MLCGCGLLVCVLLVSVSVCVCVCVCVCGCKCECFGVLIIDYQYSNRWRKFMTCLMWQTSYTVNWSSDSWSAQLLALMVTSWWCWTALDVISAVIEFTYSWRVHRSCSWNKVSAGSACFYLSPRVQSGLLPVPLYNGCCTSSMTICHTT